MAERLEARGTDEFEAMSVQLRQLKEREKDLVMKIEGLEKENGDLGQ